MQGGCQYQGRRRRCRRPPPHIDSGYYAFFYLYAGVQFIGSFLHTKATLTEASTLLLIFESSWIKYRFFSCCFDEWHQIRGYSSTHTRPGPTHY